MPQNSADSKKEICAIGEICGSVFNTVGRSLLRRLNIMGCAATQPCLDPPCYAIVLDKLL